MMKHTCAASVPRSWTGGQKAFGKPAPGSGQQGFETHQLAQHGHRPQRLGLGERCLAGVLVHGGTRPLNRARTKIIEVCAAQAV